MSERVYIAGRMRGVKFYNFPAFDKARDRLNAIGVSVISPADMDRAAGFDPTQWVWSLDDYDWGTVPDGFDLAAAVARDNDAIDSPETVAVYVISDGFCNSPGATAEVERAMRAGKTIVYDGMSDGDILKALGLGGVEAAEVRFTDPKTGGMKGEKLARFDLLPPDILTELAEHYGRGAKKYGERNMERGYPWSKTYAACQRHLTQFWCGEDADEETGSLHLIAAAWHCFTMAWFLRHGAGTDDRPSRKGKGTSE